MCLYLKYIYKYFCDTGECKDLSNMTQKALTISEKSKTFN